MPPPEKPLPRPKPPKPKPKPQLKTGPELKPTAARPRPEPEQDGTPSGFPLMPHASEPCAYYRLCPPLPVPAATVHLRSNRLPTPLIALSATLLAVSAVLLLALLVHRLVQRRRRQHQAAAPQEAPLTEEGGHQVLAAAAEEGVDDGGGGEHHVWYINTVGLNERAIAAITTVVYDGKKRGVSGALAGGGCAVCLAEFRDGETLRLLPRCRHAFHRGCIDTWLRAHVNCPLCRAPIQAAAATPRDEADASLGALGGARAEEAQRAVRRAASMVALPRRAWPDASLRWPASSSGREEELMGLGKIRWLLKFSEALEMADIGRSVSFGTASCQRLPGRSGPSEAVASVNRDELEISR